jgi:hypothetical protein
MPETPLESIRRQIRESEGRLKKAIQDEADSPPAPVPDPVLKPQDELADSSREWAAYGLMTPGFLNEICSLLAEEVHSALQGNSPHAESEWEPVVRAAETARSSLSRWIESAEFLSSPVTVISYAELLQKALAVRRAELLRWGIKVELKDASFGMDALGCNLDLFRVVMHILQYCIEQLQGDGGISNLLVHVQNPGGHVETAFVWTSSGAEPASPGRNVELLAAQKLLSRLGGKLVLENIGEKQRAVRMAFGIAAFPKPVNGHAGPTP